MIGIGQRPVLSVLQIKKLCPRINLKEFLYPAFDLFHGNVFIALWSVRPHFQPQQSRCSLDLNSAHKNIPVMYGFRTAGETPMTETVDAILHQNPLIDAVLRLGIRPGPFTAF